MPDILMIDDDARLAKMVREYLGAEGFEVSVAGTAAEGLRLLTQRPSDLVILDLMLPDGDGLDVCRRIRALPGSAATAILMLTAKGEPVDRVIGLELGADDYLPKPFEPRELLARARAVLRRGGVAATPAARVFRFGRLEIDRDARRVSIEGQPRALTSYQFELLAVMAERAGRVLSREQLIDLIATGNGSGSAHVEGDAFDRSIDVHIARIRAAIEDDVKQPRRIITVRGVGYVFARQQDSAT